jgi:hypothetical protein
MREEFDMTKNNIDSSNDSIQDPTDRVNQEDDISDQPDIRFGGPFEPTEQTVEHSQEESEDNEQTVEHSQEESEDTEQTVEHSQEESEDTEQPITPKSEPIFQLYTELFFGEPKDRVVQRIRTANNNIRVKVAGDLYEKLAGSFGKSGEHLANETYLKILEKIYAPQDLYDLFFDSMKHIKLHMSSADILDDEMTNQIHTEITQLIPSISELTTSEEE